MIKELFLPEKIGNRRIYAKKIVGLCIYDQVIQVAFINAKPSAIVVERLEEQKIEANNGLSARENTIICLKNIISLLNGYQEIRVVIPASLTILKEIELPFIDVNKIRMVLDYEIEGMLPFSLDEAVIDFIVTKELWTAKKEGSSQILAAAIRKQDLEEILNLYNEAGIDPSLITLDFFCFYNIYRHIVEYKKNVQSCAFIEIGDTNSRITFLQENQLKLTRNIPKGLSTLIHNISEETKVDTSTIETKLYSVGFKEDDTSDYDKIVQKHVISFFNEIQFTLNSFSLKLNYYEGISTLFFSGKITKVYDLTAFTTDLLQISCELFEPKKIIGSTIVASKFVKDMPTWSSFTSSLGAVIPCIEIENFDLRRKNFEITGSNLFSRQFTTAIILFLSIIFFSAVKGYLQVSTLSETAKRIEQEQVEKLIQLFPRKDRPRNASLQNLLKKSESLVKEKSSLWAPFTREKIKPLVFLLELTRILDKREFSLEIEEITITEKDENSPLIEIEGFFKSDRGLGSHYADWEILKKRLIDSSLLEFKEQPILNSAAERGIHFSLKMGKKVT